MTSETDYHFIYLIKEKEDIDSCSSIYKIGKSTQENTRRVKGYPSGSHLLLQVACIDCHSMEKFIIKEFKSLFGNPVRGREYFKGDYSLMVNFIFLIIHSEWSPHKIDYMMTNNHNMSLVVNSDTDTIHYSLNNQDNILDEYCRELSSIKMDYKHAEIKYNTYVREAEEQMRTLQNENKLVPVLNQELEHMETTIICLEQTVSKQIKSYNDLYNKFTIEVAKYDNLLLDKKELTQQLHQIRSEYKASKNDQEKEKKTWKLMDDKLHELRSANKALWKTNNELLTARKCAYIQKSYDGLSKSHKLYKKDCLSGDNDKPRISYYMLVYMLYNMTYHVYMNPYSLTNWILLSCSSIFYWIR